MAGAVDGTAAADARFNAAMKLVILPTVICTVLLVWAPAASAQVSDASQNRVAQDQPDYFGKRGVPADVSFRQAKPRTRKQHIILASLFGGAVLFSGVGLYFHLDSRDASNEVSLAGGTPSATYDQGVADVRDRAFRSRALAIVGYSIGGAFLVATFVAMAMTQPGDEIVTIDNAPKAPAKTIPVSIAPTRGGAIVGKAWSF